MKRTHKTIIGVFGLAAVAAMTFVAAGIGSPEALATSSATDTITVRVVGEAPKINFDGLPEETSTTDPEQTIKIDYENIKKIEVTITHTDPNGEKHTYVISDPNNPKYNPDGEPGTLIENIDLRDYGPGTFEITISGTGTDGVVSKDTMVIEYAPVITRTEIDPDNGDVIVYVDYDPSVVKSGEVIICINGNEKCFTYRIPDDLVDGKIIIPSSELKPGDVISVRVVAYDKDGNLIEGIINKNNGIKYEDTAVPNTGAPDTGGLFRSLNISKEDYLITGLIVFFVFGVVGFGIVARGRKNKR